MFTKILLAFDGSEHARKAAKIAGEISNTMHADLWVVYAYDPIPSYLGTPNFQAAIDNRLNIGEEVMNEAIQEIGPVSGKITKEILEGSATEAILSVADVREIDLIIMGTRGHSMLEGLLVGGQSNKIVSHAKCPVLLVR